MLKRIFTDLTGKYSDKDLSGKLWNEIVINYCDAGRYYHTLDHIEDMYGELLAVKDEIEDWDIILFSLFYHDIVYNTKRMDNESESALIAKERLQMLGVADDRISRCVLHILATKGHTVSIDNDTNLFTDADLSVLGRDAKAYQVYSRQIRKEYFVYPDDVYRAGRQKFMNHFLSMERIYKTDYFCGRYEEQARGNLSGEIEL